MAAREKEYADCGYELIAFHAANANIVLFLQKLSKKRWRCDPKSAGLGLQTLSKTLPGGYYELKLRHQILSDLKLLDHDLW
jgi:hypothetical protein